MKLQQLGSEKSSFQILSPTHALEIKFELSVRKVSGNLGSLFWQMLWGFSSHWSFKVISLVFAVNVKRVFRLLILHWCHICIGHVTKPLEQTVILYFFVLSIIKSNKWYQIYTVTVLNSEHFSLSVLNKMLVFRAGSHKMLIRKANREDPDQTASSEAVWSGSALFV